MTTSATGRVEEETYSHIELGNFELQRDEGQASIKLDRDTLNANMKKSAEVNPLNGISTEKNEGDEDGNALHKQMLDVEWYGYMYMQIARAPLVGALIVTAPVILSQAERADTFPGATVSYFNASTNTTNMTTLPGEPGRLPLAPGTISTLVSSVQNIFSALSVPVAGAIVDGTPYRKELLFTCYTFFTLCFFANGVLLSMEGTWLYIWLVGIPYVIATEWCYMGHNAYLSDCGGAGDDAHERTAALSSSSNFWGYMLTMFTVVLYTAMSLYGGFSEYALSSIYTIACTAICALYTFLGYMKLKPRSHPIHPLSKDESLLSAGFYKIYRTICTVFHEYPNLGKFLITLMLVEGAVASGNAVSVVFLKDVIKMTNTEVNVAFSIASVLSIVGAGAAWFSSKYVSPYYLLVFAICIYISGNVYFGTLVYSASEATIAMCMIGFMIGFYYSLMRAVFAIMIPAGHESQFFGLYGSCAKWLVWVPTLFYAGLNQLGSPRLGTIVGTCSLSALGLCVLLTVNIKEAREHIEHTHEHREHALKKTAEAHHK